MGQRILITNDDGIHAEGIAVLERIARQFSDDVWVVAPEHDQSGTSHSLSLQSPIRIREVAENKFAVRGTPADCVVIACRHLMQDCPPSLILSGVNQGPNLAEDMNYSGTVAAAMEGAIQGIPSIALSQNFFGAGRAIRWDTVEHHGPDVLRRLMQLSLAPGVFLNVNFPAVDPKDIAGVVATQLGTRTAFETSVHHRVDARGFPYYWISFNNKANDPAKGTDLHAMQNALISVTPLHPDLTHFQTYRSIDLNAVQEALTA